MQGLKIQNNSASFFANGSQPGGILTAPGAISNETAERLKAHWDTNYSGANVGKVAVLGDGLKYEPMAINAVDSQLIEQLKWTAEVVCATFGVPAYMAGIGAMPTYNNIEALNQQYYSQCLQIHIESIELCLNEGLALPKSYGTRFSIDDLLRMDTATMVKAEAEAVGAGIKSPNESRLRLNLPPVKGGATPYLQQQNFSLAALDDRDRGDPFAKPQPAPQIAPPEDTEEDEPDDQDAQADAARFAARLVHRLLQAAA
jgi:HK97 family phage portal protein